MPPKPPAWGQCKPDRSVPSGTGQKSAKTASKSAPVEIVSSGTAALGRPVFVPPTSPTAILTNMISRAQLNPKAPPLEPLSPTITILSQTVKAISKGEDITPYREHIQQVASNQPEKAEVVRAFVNQANHELIADVVALRADALRHIKRASRTNEMTISEAIVVWKMANELLPELMDSLNKNDQPVDTVTVVEKIDYNRQQVERSIQQKWEGTTPQGRELIRKKLWELKRQLLREQGILPPTPETYIKSQPEETETPAPNT